MIQLDLIKKVFTDDISQLYYKCIIVCINLDILVSSYITVLVLYGHTEITSCSTKTSYSFLSGQGMKRTDFVKFLDDLNIVKFGFCGDI